MPCYNPLKAWPLNEPTKNNKMKYKITNNKVDHLELSTSGNWQPMYDKYHRPYLDSIDTFIDVPCGKCLGCRLDQSKAWADRCMLELKYHASSYFLTLTYDDEHLPFSEVVDDDGCISYNNTLRKSDFQKFMKRLRKAFPEQHLRYFMCGEYGSTTYRPHYHCIVFGLSLNDLQIYKRSLLGDNYYTSNTLNSIWNRGFVVIGEVTYESCAYTARYVMKKANDSIDFKHLYDTLNVEPEFTLMSRRPGIGRQYFEDNKHRLFDSDFIYISTEDGGRKFKPPRYFKKLYDDAYGLDVEYISRQIDDSAKDFLFSSILNKAKLEQSSLDRYEQLKVDELNASASLKKLLRKEI